MGTKAGPGDGLKAVGASWTLKALMRQRTKYFDGHTIDGFEVKFNSNEKFAVDVKSKKGGKDVYNEFKSWRSSQLKRSNTLNQLANTIKNITSLDQMRFLFDPSTGWVPSPTTLRNALNDKKSLIDNIPKAQKQLLFNTSNTDEIIEALSGPLFSKIIITT